MSISFIIQFKVKQDKQSDFHLMMNNVKSELPKAKGCIGVVIHHSVDEVFNNIISTFNYTLIETWESRVLHEKHVEGLVSSGVWDHIAGHLLEDPISGYYKVI